MAVGTDLNAEKRSVTLFPELRQKPTTERKEEAERRPGIVIFPEARKSLAPRQPAVPPPVFPRPQAVSIFPKLPAPSTAKPPTGTTAEVIEEATRQGIDRVPVEKIKEAFPNLTDDQIEILRNAIREREGKPILRTLGEKGLTGAKTILDILDLPASFVRAGIRKLLGLEGGRKSFIETAPHTIPGFIVGLALDVFTDPLVFLTLPKVVTGSARLLEAGVKVGGRALSKSEIFSALGKIERAASNVALREGIASLTPQAVKRELRSVVTSRQDFRNALSVLRGVEVGEALRKGRMIEVGIPFTGIAAKVGRPFAIERLTPGGLPSSFLETLRDAAHEEALRIANRFAQTAKPKAEELIAELSELSERTGEPLKNLLSAVQRGSPLHLAQKVREITEAADPALIEGAIRQARFSPLTMTPGVKEVVEGFRSKVAQLPRTKIPSLEEIERLEKDISTALAATLKATGKGPGANALRKNLVSVGRSLKTYFKLQRRSASAKEALDVFERQTAKIAGELVDVTKMMRTKDAINRLKELGAEPATILAARITREGLGVLRDIGVAFGRISNQVDEVAEKSARMVEAVRALGKKARAAQEVKEAAVSLEEAVREARDILPVIRQLATRGSELTAKEKGIFKKAPFGRVLIKSEQRKRQQRARQLLNSIDQLLSEISQVGRKLPGKVNREEIEKLAGKIQGLTSSIVGALRKDIDQITRTLSNEVNKRVGGMKVNLLSLVKQRSKEAIRLRRLMDIDERLTSVLGKINDASQNLHLVRVSPQQIAKEIAKRFGEKGEGPVTDFILRTLGVVIPEGRALPIGGERRIVERVPFVLSEALRRRREATGSNIAERIIESVKGLFVRRTGIMGPKTILQRPVKNFSIEEANAVALGSNAPIIKALEEAVEKAPETIPEIMREAVRLRAESAKIITQELVARGEIRGEEAVSRFKWLVSSDGAMAEEAKRLGLSDFFETDVNTIFTTDIARRGRIIYVGNLVKQTLEKMSYRKLINPTDAEINEAILSFGGTARAVRLPEDILSVSPEALAEALGRSVDEITEPALRQVLLEETGKIAERISSRTVYILDTSIADHLAASVKAWGTELVPTPIVRFIGNMNNIFVRFVTSGIVVPRLAFSTRNVFQDLYAIGQSGAANPFRVFVNGTRAMYYLRLFKAGKLPDDVLEAVATRTGKTWGEVLTEIAEFGFIEEARELRAIPRGVERNAANIKRYASKIIDTLPRETADFANGIGRAGLYIEALEKGIPEPIAARLTKGILYNPRNLTPFERDILRNIFPFYNWMRYNIPRQLRILGVPFLEGSERIAPATVVRPLLEAKETLEKIIESLPEEARAKGRDNLPAWFTQALPFVIGLDDESIRFFAARFVLSPADIDALLSVDITNPWKSVKEVALDLARNVGGVLPESIAASMGLDLTFSMLSGEFVPLERVKGEKIQYVPVVGGVPISALQFEGRLTPLSLRDVPASIMAWAGEIGLAPIRRASAAKVSPAAAIAGGVLPITVKEFPTERMRAGIRAGIEKEIRSLRGGIKEAREREDIEETLRIGAEFLEAQRASQALAPEKEEKEEKPKQIKFPKERKKGKISPQLRRLMPRPPRPPSPPKLGRR